MSPPDIWTGPACPDYRLTVGADVDGHTETADRFWQQAHTLWSQAQAANCAARRRVQHTGVTRFCPVKPQHWVVASSGHHCKPYGVPSPPRPQHCNCA
jgi:hypothetical protein